MKARAICDGRGNAGTGARAVVLTLEDGTVIEKAERLEPCTNIVAEHLSIQLAMEMAIERGIKRLLILNDSQTPVYQVTGKYRVKQEHLKPIVAKTWLLMKSLDTVWVQWVPREHTVRADEMCTEVDSVDEPPEWLFERL